MSAVGFVYVAKGRAAALVTGTEIGGERVVILELTATKTTDAHCLHLRPEEALKLANALRVVAEARKEIAGA